MKKLLLTLSLVAVTTAVMAIPAKPGLWKTIRLEDGTEIRARLAGDEHAHFWITADGRKFVENDNEVFTPVSDEVLAKRAKLRRPKQAASRLLSPKKVSMGERTHYTGKKKGIVILAQFTNVKFQSANNLAKYKRILNEEGYSEGSFRGSVAEYFKDQSAGQFELDFDVVGPYTMSQKQSYYGQNDKDGNDMHAEEMIKEACQQADNEVNFADYDWDGDGEVDQVFVLYAGTGEADGGAASTIWPHMYTLEEGGVGKLTLDGAVINTYACSNEITPNKAIEGIGCFCHEFSHCMGFPDFYDTSYSGWFGMGDFDLMCAGSYNGNTFCPAGYTAHEKMMCGWQEPIVLSDSNVVVNNLQPMSKHGDTYIIYNDAYPDEYFMIENRQKTGWDASYPAKGLMITHVDFDKTIWEWNFPNTKVTTSSDYYKYYHAPLNDHQRMTLMHADNETSYESTDLYPYGKLDSLSATSKPAISLYNKNSQGTKTVKWAILDIKQNNDGTMSFMYRSPENKGGDNPTPVEPGPDPVDPDTLQGDYIFYESFDKCKGTGGNDNLWSGSIANAAFSPDNNGWTSVTNSMKGANQCARFGTSGYTGVATTPAFTVNGTATLTFKAGAWDGKSDGTTLQVDADNATITPSVFTIGKGEWTDCTATIKGTGTIHVTFTPGLRFFLDEVKVVGTINTAIQTAKSATTVSNRIYTLDGRYVGTDSNILPRGIYVINGRKFIK